MADQPDLFAATAAQLAEQGMNLAADHADAVDPNWTNRAFGMLEQYARTHYEFMGEDVRQWAHDEGGLPLPPDGRAWGFVIVRGLKEGLYECVGYRKTRIPPAHATPRAIWRSAIWQGAQTA